MLDKDQFAGFIKSQFVMFESVANGVYWNAVRDGKSGWLGLSRYNPRRELKNTADALLKNVDTLTDSFIGQYSGEAKRFASESKFGFLKSLSVIVEASINQVLTEIRAESVKKLNGQIENNPIFAQLNLKRMDRVGRSYSASYQIYLTSRHFATLVALQSDHVRFRQLKTELIDIVKDDEVIKTVSLDNMLDEEILKLFHPNSNLRTQAHVTQTKSDS